MNRKLVETLEKATDKAATLSIQRGFPITISKKSTLIGNLLVEKNKNDLYNVLKFDKSIIYENISVFDVAVIIAQRYTSGEYSVIGEVLKLEEKFSKFHIDMIHYLHCMKTAKKKNDNERLAILEDKFRMAELHAKNMKDKITIFKRVK